MGVLLANLSYFGAISSRERISLQLWKDACLELSRISAVYLNEKKTTFYLCVNILIKGHLKKYNYTHGQITLNNPNYPLIRPTITLYIHFERCSLYISLVDTESVYTGQYRPNISLTHELKKKICKAFPCGRTNPLCLVPYYGYYLMDMQKRNSYANNISFRTWLKHLLSW